MDPHKRDPESTRLEEIDDPVTKLLKESGCLRVNTELQECMFQHKDWRKCQSLVQALKECMEGYKQQKQ